MALKLSLLFLLLGDWPSFPGEHLGISSDLLTDFTQFRMALFGTSDFLSWQSINSLSAKFRKIPTPHSRHRLSFSPASLAFL